MALEAKLQQETSNNSVCIALDDKTRVDSKNIIKINLILLSKKVFHIPIRRKVAFRSEMKSDKILPIPKIQSGPFVIKNFN